MKTIKFARWYRKLGLRVFSTIRKAGYEVEQEDRVHIQYPDGTLHGATVLLVHEKPLDQLPSEFLMTDTDTVSRDDATRALQVFYPDLTPSSNVTVVRVEYDDPVKLDCYMSILPAVREHIPLAHFEIVTRQGANSPLSPSWDLLNAAKAGEITWDEYKTRLRAEIASRIEAKMLLSRLKTISRERLVFPVCFEKDPTKCHRSLVKELIIETS